MHGSTLYATLEATAFYLIPNNTKLPTGSLALRSLRGASLQVHPAAAKPWRISEARAKEITQETLSEVAEQARGALGIASGLASAEPLQPPASATALLASLQAMEATLQGVDLKTSVGRAGLQAQADHVQAIGHAAAAEGLQGDLDRSLSELLKELKE